MYVKKCVFRICCSLRIEFTLMWTNDTFACTFERPPLNYRFSNVKVLCKIGFVYKYWKIKRLSYKKIDIFRRKGDFAIKLITRGMTSVLEAKYKNVLFTLNIIPAAVSAAGIKGVQGVGVKKLRKCHETGVCMWARGQDFSSEGRIKRSRRGWVEGTSRRSKGVKNPRGRGGTRGEWGWVLVGTRRA